jgi:glutamine synthetase
VSSDIKDPSQLAAALSEAGVGAVALTYVDNSGITRVKAVPTSRLEAAVTSGVGMSPVFDVMLVDDSVTESGTSTGPVGDLRLYPDLNRLVRLAAQPGWAWAPVDRRSQAGEPHPRCQRTFVTRMVDRAASRGLTALMSFETEWVLDAGTGEELVPATAGPAYGMTRVIDRSDYLRDVLQALAEESVRVEQIHPEYAAGQYELSVGPSDPVSAADDAVLVRQTVRAIGSRHGLRTSYSPSVIAGAVGNGCHLHLSIWRDGNNLFTGGVGPYGLTSEAQSFLAGVLAELPALLVIGAPSVASYLRLVPQHWAGAYRCWGRENREAAVRLVTGTQGHERTAANAEVKCFDASGSPYLVAGAVLAAGLAGIADGLGLGPEVTVDPASLGEDEQARLGTSRLPTSLGEALEHYEKSEVLGEALGHELYETIAAVRRAEIALFAGASPEEVAATTRWRH